MKSTTANKTLRNLWLQVSPWNNSDGTYKNFFTGRTYTITKANTWEVAGSVTVTPSNASTYNFAGMSTVNKTHSQQYLNITHSTDYYGTFNFICGCEDPSMDYYGLQTNVACSIWIQDIPAKTTYSVSYNANSGSGAPSSQTKWYGEALTLSSTKPTRDDYSFWHWNTNTSNTGTTYNSGASYTANAAATLYAIWNPIISYNANGGSSIPSAQTKTYGTNLTLSSTVPTRTNYEFYHWNTASNNGGTSYSPGGTYALNTAATLYAIWNPVISYDANGGSGAPLAQTKTYGAALTLSQTVPTKSAHEFKGWATTSTGSVAYVPGGTYPANLNDAVTLYAVWEPLLPTIEITDVVRCDGNGQSDIYGGYAKVYGTWSVTNPEVDPETDVIIRVMGWQTRSDGTEAELVYTPEVPAAGSFEQSIGYDPCYSHDVLGIDGYVYPQQPIRLVATIDDGVFQSTHEYTVPAASSYVPPTISITSAFRSDHEGIADALGGYLCLGVSYTRNVKQADTGVSRIPVSVKDPQDVEVLSGSISISMSSTSGNEAKILGSPYDGVSKLPPDQQRTITVTTEDLFDTATATYTLPVDPGYFPPEIGVVSVERCDGDGYADDLGEHLKVTMGYRMYNSVSDYVSTLYLLDGLDVADIESQESVTEPSFEPVGAITGLENPSEEGWYESDGQGGYVPTTDRGVVFGKRYYVLVSGGVYGVGNPSPTRGSYDTWTVIVGYAPYTDTSSVVQSTGPIDPVVQYVVRAKITDGYKTIYSDRTVAVSPYYPPYISSINVFRCDQHGEFEDDGMYAAAELGWGIYPTRSQTRPVSVTVDLLDSNGDLVSTDDFTSDVSTTSGTDTILVVGNDDVSQDSTYLVRVTIEDKHNSVTAGDYVYTAYFPLDVRAGGHGIAFGKPAKRDMFDVAMPANFDKAISIAEKLSLPFYHYESTPTEIPTVPCVIIDGGNSNRPFLCLPDANYDPDDWDGNWDSVPLLADFVKKSGDTMTGHLYMKSSFIDRDAANPTAQQGGIALILADKDSEQLGLVQPLRETDGRVRLWLGAYNEKTDGTQVGNGIGLYIAKDGTCTYSVSSAANFRSAIGAFASSGGNITGDTSLSSGKLFTVDKVQSRTRSISYIAGAKGNAALYCPKTYNADAWYPAVCLETKGGGSWQIGNYNNEYLQFVYATKANRDSGTNTTTAVNLRSTGGTIALTSEVDARVPKPAVLYNNTTGTTGTVGLSATAANYNHMRVFYYDKSGASGHISKYNCTEVFSPNGKKVDLHTTGPRVTNDTNIYIATKMINISATSITVSRALAGGGATDSTSWGAGVWNEIYIVRVEAWND